MKKEKREVKKMWSNIKPKAVYVWYEAWNEETIDKNKPFKIKRTENEEEAKKWFKDGWNINIMEAKTWSEYTSEDRIAKWWH